MPRPPRLRSATHTVRPAPSCQGGLVLSTVPPAAPVPWGPWPARTLAHPGWAAAPPPSARPRPHASAAQPRRRLSHRAARWWLQVARLGGMAASRKPRRLRRQAAQQEQGWHSRPRASPARCQRACPRCSARTLRSMPLSRGWHLTYYDGQTSRQAGGSLPLSRVLRRCPLGKALLLALNSRQRQLPLQALAFHSQCPALPSPPSYTASPPPPRCLTSCCAGVRTLPHPAPAVPPAAPRLHHCAGGSGRGPGGCGPHAARYPRAAAARGLHLAAGAF